MHVSMGLRSPSDDGTPAQRGGHAVRLRRSAYPRPRGARLAFWRRSSPWRKAPENQILQIYF